MVIQILDMPKISNIIDLIGLFFYVVTDTPKTTLFNLTAITV